MMGEKSRKKPWDVKLRIDHPLRDAVGTIARAAGCGFSDCVEALLLLTRAQYLQSGGDGLVYRLLEIKSERVLMVTDIKAKASRASCHVMLSADVRDFATLLCESYPPVFGSVNEAIVLCLMYWQPCCESKERLEYVARRLSSFLAGQPK
ncbi:MAG: hypothetical protein ACI36Y_09455 [Coriobacteriales bacterium]